ncbi:NAD-dependent epimerase/dehydratase family protein [Rossellomorea aquimaris]|uniref:NAD-dependent epimerase/dehydratase family protein n=1 Tax=Rossellomorea aquimaris TaxID=189382 RepID=UPI001CD6FC70|nr:NAD-dependent epimerase/dehydratase family protein [Rossellomorea aquimaris]MCA1060512.1 NAD-dependent epimerase/dehydratase family protein [Rossellomorea aquimaris]
MNIEGKKILVTGVTGTLGEKVAASFVESAEEVRGLVRDESQFNRLRGIGIIPVRGELIDRSSLRRSVENIDLIIHCAAYLGDEMEEAEKSNVTGVENLASVAWQEGVKRFIHISTISVYGEPTEGDFDEQTTLNPYHDEAYIQTKVKSELILKSYSDKGLDVVILRPGAICSEENSYWGDRQIHRMAHADVVDWVHPDDLIPWIHKDNLVEMIHLVTEKGSSGDVFNAIDGNIPDQDFRKRLIDILGKELKLPNRIVERPMYSNQKIRELGYVPGKSFEDTMRNLGEMAIKMKDSL